jgi:hypothetical protein
MSLHIPTLDRARINAIPALYTISKKGNTIIAEPTRDDLPYFKNTDASTVIQKALDNLTSGRTWKETIVIKGDFEISQVIKIPSYTRLILQGKLKLKANVDTSKLIEVTTDRFVWITNSDHINGNTAIEIIGGVIDGNKDNNTATIYGLEFNHVTDVIVAYTKIMHVRETALAFESWNGNSYRCYALFNYIEDTLYDGMGNQDGSDFWYVGNVVKGAIPLTGITVDKGSNVYIIGNLVDGVTNNGIWAKANSSKVKIIGNTSRNNGYSGIVASGVDILISGNIAYGNSDYGGALLTGCDQAKVFLNDFRGNITGAFLVQTGVTNYEVKHNLGYVTENRGVATFSGDGVTAQFVIAHGLAGAPSVVNVTPASADASGDFYITSDASNIYVNFISAPPTGTDNVVLNWSAEI